MKQLLIALLLALLVAPSAYAHTQLLSTAPAHGDVVTTPLTEISLTYAGKIEEGSHFELTNANGDELEIVSLTVLEGVMTGIVAEPLANGEYKVKWDSISEDGHPLNGIFSFTVNVPEGEQPGVTEQQEKTDSTEQEQIDATEQTTTESAEVPAEETSNTSILIVVGILAVIIVASLIVLFTRRKG